MPFLAASRSKKIIVAGLAALAIAGAAAIVVPRQPRVTVTFFDVGQGDAVLISSGRRQMLVDGGPDRRILAKLGRAMPLFDRTIEDVVLTHPHADHFSGLPAVFDRYEVRRILISGAGNATAEHAHFERAASSSGARIVEVRRGDRIRIGEFAEAAVLWPADGRTPEDVNDASVVLRLKAFGRPAVLLMGDATERVEERLLADGDALAAPVLKAGHHGSRFSSTADFLRVADAAEAVISVGRNRYGHPSPATLLRLKASGARVRRTDREGDVRFTFRPNEKSPVEMTEPSFRARW
jgi:competence protein ComEC